MRLYFVIIKYFIHQCLILRSFCPYWDESDHLVENFDKHSFQVLSDAITLPSWLCQILATQMTCSYVSIMMVPYVSFWNLEDKFGYLWWNFEPFCEFDILHGRFLQRTSDRADILLIAEWSAKAFPLWPLFTVGGSLPLGQCFHENFFVLIVLFGSCYQCIYLYYIFSYLTSPWEDLNWVTWIDLASGKDWFYRISSVTQLCLTLCDPTDCSMTGFPVHYQLPELIQTHVHRVSDAFQPSHPLLSFYPPAFNLSQHHGLFQWVSSLHQVAKVLEFQLQHQSFQWILRTNFL